MKRTYQRVWARRKRKPVERLTLCEYEDLIDDPTENSRDEGSSVTVDETLGVDPHDQSSVPNLAGQTEETNATNNSREEVDDYFFLDTRNEVLVESDFDSGIEYEIGELLGQDEDYFQGRLFLNYQYDSDDEDAAETPNLADKLQTWGATQQVTMTSIDSLLRLLQKWHPELPRTARTLLGTRRTSIITQEISGMEVFKYNVETELRQHVQR